MADPTFFDHLPASPNHAPVLPDHLPGALEPEPAFPDHVVDFPDDDLAVEIEEGPEEDQNMHINEEDPEEDQVMDFKVDDEVVKWDPEEDSSNFESQSKGTILCICYSVAIRTIPVIKMKSSDHGFKILAWVSGSNILVAFDLAFHFQHALLTGVASGIAFVLGVWRLLQLLFSAKMVFFTLTFLLSTGSTFTHISAFNVTKLVTQKKISANTLVDATGFSVSTPTLHLILSCLTVALHALGKGLALGVAAPKAYGFDQHMVLSVSLHGLTHRAALAS
nr:putative zinc transporter At3g08650 [Tanacetum cinerariifolium]